VRGASHSCRRGLTFKFDKNFTHLFRISIWGDLELCLGGKPTKTPLATGLCHISFLLNILAFFTYALEKKIFAQDLNHNIFPHFKCPVKIYSPNRKNFYLTINMKFIIANFCLTHNVST